MQDTKSGRRPGLVGSGLVSASKERSGIVWSDVHRVDVYPAQRVISLRDSWHTALRLYCPPENFAAVVTRVRAYAANAARLRAASPEQAASGGWRFALLWLGASLLAAVAGLIWESDALPGFAFTAGPWSSLRDCAKDRCGDSSGC